MKPDLELKCCASKVLALKGDESSENELSSEMLTVLDCPIGEMKNVLESYQDYFLIKINGLFSLNTKAIRIKKQKMFKLYVMEKSSFGDLLIIGYTSKESKRLLGLRFKSKQEQEKFIAELPENIRLPHYVSTLLEDSSSEVRSAIDGSEPNLINSKDSSVHQDEFELTGTDRKTPAPKIEKNRKISLQVSDNSIQNDMKYTKGSIPAEYTDEKVRDNSSTRSSVKSKFKWNKKSSLNYPIDEKRFMTPIATPIPVQQHNLRPIQPIERAFEKPPITSISAKEYFKFNSSLSKFNTRTFMNYPERIPKNVDRVLDEKERPQYYGTGSCFYDKINFMQGKRTIWQADSKEIKDMTFSNKSPMKLLLRKDDQAGKKSQYVVLGLSQDKDVFAIMDWFKENNGKIETDEEGHHSTPEVSEASTIHKTNEFKTAELPIRNNIQILSQASTPVTSFTPISDRKAYEKLDTRIVYQGRTKKENNQASFEVFHPSTMNVNSIEGVRTKYPPKEPPNYPTRTTFNQAKVSNINMFEDNQDKKKKYATTQYFDDDLWEVDETFVSRNRPTATPGSVYLWVGHTKYPYWNKN